MFFGGLKKYFFSKINLSSVENLFPYFVLDVAIPAVTYLLKSLL